MLIIQTKKYRYEINKIFFEQLAFFVCTLPIAGIFTLFCCNDTIAEQQSTLELLSSIATHNPFQYRALAPLLYSWAHSISGLDYDSIAVGFTFVSAVGVVYSFRSLLQTVTIKYNVHFWPFIILIPLFFNYTNFLSTQQVFYPYDLPAIIFFSFALSSLLRGNYKLYYLNFSLAILNRETGIVISLIFLMVGLLKIPKPYLFLHLITQGALFMLISTSEHQIFLNNPGSAFEVQFSDNIRELIRFSPIWISKVIVLFLSFGGMWILAILRRKNWQEPTHLLLRFFIFLFIVMSYGVNITELHIYNEFVPVITLAAIDG